MRKVLTLDELTCKNCGSEKVIPDARLDARGHSNYWHPTMAAVEGDPDALIMHETERGKVTIRLCCECGYMELYCQENLDKLWQAHLKAAAHAATKAAEKAQDSKEPEGSFWDTVVGD